MKSRLNQLFPALALIGLMIGCGGNTTPENKPPKGEGNKSANPEPENNASEGEGNQSAVPKTEDKTADLATFLPGKRIVVQMPMPPNAPPPPPNASIPEILYQFEADDILKRGMLMNGQSFGLPGKLTYKVTGMKVTVLKEDGKEDGGVTFQSATPKKGDKIMLQQTGAAAEQPTTISGIEKASALKPPPSDEPGGPDTPAPTKEKQ